jgi:hypothetical protein
VVLTVLIIVTMFLWGLTILPLAPLEPYARGSAFLTFIAVLLIVLFLFVPGLR